MRLAYRAGYGDKHLLLPGPDMQMIRREDKLFPRTARAGGRPRQYLELAPKRIDVALQVVHAHELHHVVPDRRVCPVSSNHEVKADLDLFGAYILMLGISNLEPRLTLAEVCSRQLVVEEQLDVVESVDCVQQLLVQLASIDSMVGLEKDEPASFKSKCRVRNAYTATGIVILRLLIQSPIWLAAVQHTPSHWDPF
jgi:hypothetical protein